MTTLLDTRPASGERPIVVRLAGDSGDGIQLAGSEFAKSTAGARAEFMTFPDYPAEIRAPAGTLFGVSAFQIQFGTDDVLTPGDEADVLVAFNPAALKTNLNHLKRGGLLIVDTSNFDARGLKKAGMEASPLEDGSLSDFQLIEADIVARAREAVAALDLGRKQAAQAKNFWVLGLVYWLFDRTLTATETWISEKFAPAPETVQANQLALRAGHAYGETLELATFPQTVEPSRDLDKADVQVISGTRAMTLGIAAISALSDRDVLYCSYPITPASALLHGLAAFKDGVRTFQAEDEIAAISAAIGASYAGAIGITASSGPGISLKTEALGLAIMAELPLIVLDVQRAGPSTGMPTKPEQSDLNMAVYGRHGEAPCPVLAPATPADCFDTIIEAARIAVEAMTPVIVLSDAFLANAASDWIAPDVDALPDLSWTMPEIDGAYEPYARDPKTLARLWVTPGSEGLAHRIGGLEKQDGSGAISYDPDNHQKMVALRAEKVARVAERAPEVAIETGVDEGELLVIGWGSTHGSIKQAVTELNAQGHRIAHAHLRQLWPLPRGLEDLLKRFPKAVTAELNMGQLSGILRSEYLVPVECIAQVNGQPFPVAKLKSEILDFLEG